MMLDINTPIFWCFMILISNTTYEILEDTYYENRSSSVSRRAE